MGIEAQLRVQVGPQAMTYDYDALLGPTVYDKTHEVMPLLLDRKTEDVADHIGVMVMNQKPNVIVILADDMGYGDAGCFEPSK